MSVVDIDICSCGCGEEREIERLPKLPRAIVKLERPSYTAQLRPVIYVLLAAALFSAVIGGIFEAYTFCPAASDVQDKGSNSLTLGAFGYAEGAAQPRTLEIYDGGSKQLARFEASGDMTVSGALHVTGVCGEWVLDARTGQGWRFTSAANVPESCR